MRGAMAGLAVVALAATMAGFAADQWWALEWVAAPRPHYAVAAAVLAAAAVWARAWLSVTLAVAVVVVNAAVVVPLWVDGGAPARADAASLDVAFFNAKIRADRDAVAAALRDDPPDVAVLSAVTSSWAEAMEADSGMEVALSRPPGVDLELLVLTAPHVGVVDADIIARDGSRDSLVEVTVDAGFGPVGVLGLHPVSPVGAERTARRDAVLAAAADWAIDQPGPAVVVGDLNAVPWSPAFRRLLADGGLVDSQRGRGPQPSWPAVAGPLGVPLDHVLHTPDLTTVDRARGGAHGSDHRLVRATLAPTGE